MTRERSYRSHGDRMADAVRIRRHLRYTARPGILRRIRIDIHPQAKHNGLHFCTDLRRNGPALRMFSLNFQIIYQLLAYSYL